MTDRHTTPAARDDAADTALPFTVHVGEADAIRREADRARSPRHLVVTPVRLHRRNVQRRLREDGEPRSGFEFLRLVDVARRVNEAATAIEAGPDERPETESLDRLDRLALTRRVLRGGSSGVAGPLGRTVGTPVEDHAERIERARVGLEMVTAFHPGRLDALEAAIDALDGTARADARDLVGGLLALQRELDDRSPVAVSDAALLRVATATAAAAPEAIEAAYPDADTLSVAGVSTLTASLEDFLFVLGGETSIDVHLYLRHGTGPQIGDQLAAAGERFDPEGVRE
ncbi:hypothetical protein GCM10027435_22140 [Haloparvum alkalitolerans]|uniref:hypothetical protein n=1 Tax=Haloparvum alkalitolerans TaxID=1042953 RepID=UPI003CEB0E5E